MLAGTSADCSGARRRPSRQRTRDRAGPRWARQWNGLTKRVTRDIDPADGRDLLERVPRACLAFASAEDPQALPAVLVARDGRYLVGISELANQCPGPGQEAVVLVDEGVHYFDLRAIYIRGHSQPVGAPTGANGDHNWFEVIPLKTVAWDYSSRREADDER
jgi:hypothetical protein